MRRLSKIRIACLLSLALAGTAGAAPLDPAAFASLGTLSATSGAVAIDTGGSTPTLTLGAQVFKGVTVAQGGGLPEIAVFTFDRIDIGANATVSGTGSRPLALLSRTSATVAPTITFNGGAGVWASGGAAGVWGGAPLGQGPGAGTGASAGGGFGGAGGASLSSAGGAAYGDLSAALQGGSGGAATNFRLSGGGAGALEIGALGAVSVGTVLANGGKGEVTPNGTQAFGGGSGGAILLHGSSVQAASLQARGGSGADAVTIAGAGGGGGRILALVDRFELGATPLTGDVSGGTGGHAAFAGAAGQSGVIELKPQLTVVGAGRVFSPAADGRVALTGGTLLVPVAVELRAGGAGLASSAYASTGALTLQSGSAFTALSTVRLDHALSIAGGSAFTAIGGTTASGAITLDGGSFTALGGLASSGVVEGHGNLFGPVSGTAAGTLRARDGTLTVGDANRLGGVAWQGALTVASRADAPATLQLQSADAVALPSTLLDGPGARLFALNGMQLGAGQQLTANDASRISGAVRNDGLVRGPDGGTAFLSFDDLVTGTGSYTGQVRFAGGLSPGASPALVQAGTLTLADTNTLTMELGGRLRGTEHDAIDATGTLTLGGTLDVVLLASSGTPFTPQAGDRFDLLRGAQIVGSFSAQHLPTLGAGLQWHTDTLAEGGYDLFRLSVQAVPEPSTAWLLLGGVAWLLAWRRRAGSATR